MGKNYSVTENMSSLSIDSLLDDGISSVKCLGFNNIVESLEEYGLNVCSFEESMNELSCVEFLIKLFSGVLNFNLFFLSMG